MYERELDIYELFNEAVEQAIRERVDLVVHSGDFFDSPRPPPQAIRAAVHTLRRLRERGIPVVAVLGDHDIPKRRGEHPLSILADLGLLRVLMLDEESTLRLRTRSGVEVFLAGLPHHRRVSASKLKLRLSKLRPPDERIPKILVLHQGLEGYAPEPELNPSELPRGYSYYALGHVHAPQSLRVGAGLAVYPGSLDALRLDEAVYDHGFVIAEVDYESAVATQVKLSSRRPQLLIRVDYSKLVEQLHDAARKLSAASASKKPLVHIIVEGEKIDRQKVYKLIQSVIAPHALYVHLVVRERRVEAGRVTVEDISGKLDIHELLVKMLGGDKQLAELAYRLLELVSHGAGDAEIHHAVEEYFRARYGGDTQ